jgi:hypothetical protein
MTCNHTTNERNELLDQGFCPVCANRDFARLVKLTTNAGLIEMRELRAENERLREALQNIALGGDHMAWPTTPRPWQANFAHWGRSDITHPCSDESEWDGNLRINGKPHIYVANNLAPGDADLIVRAVNALDLLIGSYADTKAVDK